ncbi:surface carbohydrate biosynthesis protein [Oceanobacillus polygoni]|uniref:Surface carbohydrate biosynthesis protein n=1 Tax=Oceanobacillus polygoni TaxID=1235259 RepID=A0A9X0YSE9_9BACI|nr:surface carbohydrate biosynthesis protein [Oceanobacillus polygoni]MBP2077987.1 surface carbohydrate biosynthesis protein [Oceanobacillus polygoni]
MGNFKSWLYLPVEIKVRELDAKLLLAYHAAKEGYHVIIGEHRMVELASKTYPAGIFFSKGYPKGFRKRIITNAKSNGHIVVELDEEGLILSDTSQYIDDRMKVDMLHLVTQEYCWGEFQKETITNAAPTFASNCHIVGHPRFDLLKSKFAPLYKKEVEDIRNKYHAFVLINTRFSLYNSITEKKNQNTDALTLYIKRLYYHFLDLVKVMCERFPDTNFIIRPHPGESVNAYREVFSEYQNVHVIHEGNIIKWLMAAEVIVQNGCTSSIEAFLVGRPIISFIPITSEEYEVVFPNELGIKAKRAKEVNNILEAIINKPFTDNSYEQQIKKSENYLRKYYKGSNEEFSYVKILRLLSTIKLPPSSRSLSPLQKTFYLKENKKVKYFFPSLTKSEILLFFNKLNKVENDNSQFLIKKLGTNLYAIQKK